MDIHRRHWNEKQKELKAALSGKTNRDQAAELFLPQQAMLFTRELNPSLAVHSFEDEVWSGISDDEARQVPEGFDHSIAWMMWHTSRCEDITMNLLVACRPQVLLEQNWLEKMNIEARDTGNVMGREEASAFNQSIHIPELRGYRLSVGRRTREIFLALEPAQFKQKINPELAGQIFAQSAVLPEARGLVNYWTSRTVAGLFLMPATRHHLVHINEAIALKKKLKRR